MFRRSIEQSAHITFTIEGDSIRPWSFAESVQTFERLLEDVDRICSADDRQTLRWELVKIGSGSIEMSLVGAPRSEDVAPNLNVPGHCVRAVQDVANGRVPQSDRNLRTVERVLAFRRSITGGLTGFNVDAPSTGEQVRITKAVVESAERLLARSTTIGAIEGRLEALNIHDRPRFTVYDAVTGAGTACFFGDELLKEVVGSVGAKVLVAGKIRRDRDGRPREIRGITEFRRLGRPIGSPSVLELEGVYSAMEGDTLDYLAEIRGE